MTLQTENLLEMLKVALGLEKVENPAVDNINNVKAMTFPVTYTI
jgi:hypothetical protein